MSVDRTAVDRLDGPILAGLGCDFGANVGLQTVHYPYEIVYPGYVSTRAVEKQIPLSDLQVIYDASAERLKLISAPLQREVIPLHLSLAADVWLSPIYRFILSVFGNGPTNLIRPTLSAFHRQAPPQAVPVRFTPRLCLGCLVLERAEWAVQIDVVPLRAKGESAFAYLARLQQWLADNRLPQACFVRTFYSLPPSEVDDPQQPRTGPHKPLYVDFRSYLSVMLFERMVKHSAQVITFQEALPGEHDLWLSCDDAAYVTEWIFELTAEAS